MRKFYRNLIVLAIENYISVSFYVMLVFATAIFHQTFLPSSNIYKVDAL